jgi:Ca2+-binding RTX toxin-like protein
MMQKPSFIETLEGRRLFAGFSLNQHHQLNVIGSGNFPNTITVGLTPDGKSIQAEIQATVYNHRVVTFEKTYPLSDKIRKVYIQGGSSYDTITIDQTYGSFPIPCEMVGGAGDDTIVGGDEPDTMFGGSGNDSLVGNSGNDVLYGGKGLDTLLGGPGNDYLNGGQNSDSLVGGDGNDTLVDFQGPDKVYGGAGNNVFYIPSFAEDPQNDFNKTTDKVHYVTYIPPSNNDNTSLLDAAFPILNLL